MISIKWSSVNKIHELDKPEAMLTVKDMDFANMLQILINKQGAGRQ